MSKIRLDKYLADAGIGSRSQVKNIIRQKMIMVNGIISTVPEQKVSLTEDTVTYKGNVVSLTTYEYYILNKPAGYVTARKDNINPTVMSLFKSPRKDLAPVGRLDKDTEGLLLITNDGELTHKLLSPKYHVDKTYYAVLDKQIDDHDIRCLSDGIEIHDDEPFTAMPAVVKCLDNPLSFDSSYYTEQFPFLSEDINLAGYNDHEQFCFVLITIQEGKYHQVKRMFKAVGANVLYLRRISFGKLKIPNDLRTGECKQLLHEDIIPLLHFTDLKC